MSFKLLDPLGNQMRSVQQFCREGARRVGHIGRNRSGYIINLLLLYVDPAAGEVALSLSVDSKELGPETLEFLSP